MKRGKKRRKDRNGDDGGLVVMKKGKEKRDGDGDDSDGDGW